MSGTGGSLWIGYADTDGGLTHRIIEPMAIAAGYVTAFDQLSGEIKRFAIARISGVAAIDQ
jgi:predicted DNA-binding transcriptional regulator YafY